MGPCTHVFLSYVSWNPSPSTAPPVCSTWVTINFATRRLSKLPDDLRNRFLRFSPDSSL